VRLGNSGLKVSKIILGTMQYGDTRWQAWVKGQEEANEHIKAAYVMLTWYSDISNLMQRYDAGIQTFDTANVRPP